MPHPVSISFSKVLSVNQDPAFNRSFMRPLLNIRSLMALL